MLPFETILRTPTRSEEVVPSFRLDWYGDRDVAVYTLVNRPDSPDEIDQFMARLHRMVDEWPQDKPLRVIITIYPPAHTPYTRQQLHHAFDVLPAGSAGRVAFVLPDAPAGQIVRLFARREQFPALETHTFTRVTQAAAWVESYDLRSDGGVA
jgi:hypothetical protein